MNHRLMTGFILVSLMALSSCATTHPGTPVRMTAEGNLNTYAMSNDKQKSIDCAEQGADIYCNKQKKIVMIIKEETVYKGLLPENINELARRAGGLSRRLEQGTASKVLGAGSSDEDYQTKIEFQCR